MKIALTGHTRGFGQYIKNRLELSNVHELVCFSKSTGYDITKVDDRKKIIDESEDCIIFINCAQSGFAQTELLYERFYSWAKSQKIIINIGSNSRDFANRDRPYDYAVQKNALNIASKQLGRCDVCKVVTVDYGHLNRTDGTAIGYEAAFDYLNIALESLFLKHRLLEILVAHE